MNSRKGSGNARPEDWAWLDALVGRLDEDCVQALTEWPANQERPALKIFNRADLSKPQKAD